MYQANISSAEHPLAADEISIKKIILHMGRVRRLLFSKWKMFFLVALTGGVLGLLYASFKKIVYTAECTFVLEEGDKSSPGLGQYSSLASMVGIDVGGSTGLFQGENITQLYNSRLMLEKTLLTPANFNGKPELLINRYLRQNKPEEVRKAMHFDIPREKFDVKQDSMLQIIIGDIGRNYLSVSKPDKKLSMVSVKVKSEDPLFAKAFTESIVSNVNTFYIQTKTKGATHNVQLLNHQADSIHRILNASIGNAAFASDANPNPDPALAQILRAPSQRRMIDVQAATAIYTEVVRNLEVSRGVLQRSTPLIQVIDYPLLPLPNDRVGRLRSAINGVVIAVLIFALWVIIQKGYNGIMN